MVQKITFTFSLWLIVLAGFSQKHSSVGFERSKRFSVFIAPIGLIDLPSIPRLRLGTEFQISKKFSLAYDFGLFPPRISQYSNIKGYQMKTELKYFLFRKDLYFIPEDDRANPKENIYIALDFLYRNLSYDVTDSIHGRKDSVNYRIIKTFNIDKVIESLVVRFGKRFIISSHFYMDLSAGVGVRARIANRTGLDDSEYPLTNDGFVRSAMYSDTDGQHFVPDIQFCLKLGYAF